MNTVRALGICIGASTIKAVEIDSNKNIVKTIKKCHECNPKKVLTQILDSLGAKDYTYITVTGRKFKSLLTLPTITEPEATEFALKDFLGTGGSYDALVSMGSENFILYVLDSKGSIIKVHTGNKCASGTGEFLLQQIRRMDIPLDTAIDLAHQSEPHKVSGRCSVFCKSDCTHALNIGVPKGEICAGLGNMISDKVLELLHSDRLENVIVVGGVTQNSYVMKCLKSRIKNLTIPKDADLFEALGAALYALENKTTFDEVSLNTESSTFSTLPPLENAQRLVEFHEQKNDLAKDDDTLILGLDVGSTTTKAVLVRQSDNHVVASIYLRTNGDPVGASRNCYTELKKQIGDTKVKIIGLGVTGSGRQIAGLHALTEGVINEIIAHASAASYFDKDVDTIFEIGGQDAKYTYLVNGVPCDYAMNEACSAGTGSFLEEAAKESLNIDYLEIEKIAVKGQNPPNFNDQCAAFISSDIKNASHESISREDIIAGLVYSICMNYTNRVKGSRVVGKKIFMQGGVCYNKAVPLAMASLLQKKIIVPPNPGLMGAFGVALEVKNKLSLGLLEPKEFDLDSLIERKVSYGTSFECKGMPENCDRKCKINIIKMDGKSYAFGGICNKYYNIMHHLDFDPKKHDLVEKRQNFLFNDAKVATEGKTIGIPRSFYTHILFRMYFHFFTKLGFKVILSDEIDKEGKNRVCSSFCFPVELSHGSYMNLLKKNLDYIFLPQVSQLYVDQSRIKGTECHSTCVIGQAEPYYLQSAFKESTPMLLSPVLDFSKGWDSEESAFVTLAAELDKEKDESAKAYHEAVEEHLKFVRQRKTLGKKMLEELEKDPSKKAVVIFGRAYNAFAEDANMGIPKKFASRNISVIPYDCLPFEREESIKNMTWATGQEIIKAARYVKKHRQLYGTYITNFSCGPDSFLIGYFRDIMGTKPSLTLELDSHSADAGINTRIEAFLDIVERFTKMQIKDKEPTPFQMAEIKIKSGKPIYVASDNKEYGFNDPKVKMILPSMGHTTAELAACAFTGSGIQSEAVPVPDFKTLMIGRANTSCKECLPLILTTSTLMKYMEQRKDNNELLIYFMPTTTGSCRFSQYFVFLEQLIRKNHFENVALLSLTSENSYAGLGIKANIKVVQSIILADILEEIKSALLVLPKDKVQAKKIFDEEYSRICSFFKKGKGNLNVLLESVAKNLAKIELKYPISDAKKVILDGEIYVRKDEFSSQPIVDMLASKDIIVKRAPVLEWLEYVDYLASKIFKVNSSFKDHLELTVRRILLKRIERKMKKALSNSNLYEYEEVDIEHIIKTGSQFMNPLLTGEQIVVVGTFFNEVANRVHGLVSIGPFGCLPSRVVESILGPESQVADNEKVARLIDKEKLKKLNTLPFLSVESDGNPFPQIVEARVEAFALQVKRVHKMMQQKEI